MATVEDSVKECDEDCEFTSDNAIIYSINITSSEVKKPKDTTEHSSNVGVTNSPGRVQINLNKPSPRVNESDFEPIFSTEKIIISDELSGVTVKTNDGVMMTNPNVAIEIKFTDKKPTEENVSVKFSFGDEDEEENEIEDTLIDNSGRYDAVTEPLISTTTQFFPPTFESLPMFEKDIFTTTEAAYNGILTPEETTGTKMVENKLPTAAVTIRPEKINFTTMRPGAMTVNTSSTVIKGNPLINSDTMDDLEEKNTIKDIKRPAMPRFDEIGGPTESSASSTPTASTLIIESTSKTAKNDVESVITSQGDNDVSISQSSSTSNNERLIPTLNTEEVLSTSTTEEVFSSSTSNTEGLLGSKEASSAFDMNIKLDETTISMAVTTKSDFVTDDMNSSNQLPGGIETAITGSDGEIPEQTERTDISTSSAIKKIFRPNISSTDKPIKSQTSTSTSSQTTIEQSSPAESHETLSSPEIMSSTEPTKTTIYTFPSSAVKIPVLPTEEQQTGRSGEKERPVPSSVLTTQQPTTKNILINDLTPESTEVSPFEIGQTTETISEQTGLDLTTEMSTDGKYSDSEIQSVTTTNTIIGGGSVSPLPSEISSAPDRTKEKEKTVIDVIGGAEERSGVTQREDMSDQTSSVGVGGKVLVTTVSYGLEYTMKTPTSTIGQTNQERYNSNDSSTSSSTTTLTSIMGSPSPSATPRTDDVMTTKSLGSSPSSRTEAPGRSSVSRVPSPPQPRLDDGLLPGN